MNQIKKKFIKKCRTSFIAVTMFTSIVSASTHVNYTKLSKYAGMSHIEMKKLIKKLVKIESPRGSYYAKNKSGAYGLYQIMPKTARYYTKKLKIPHHKWKHPRNQDKIFTALMRDNISMLKKNGLAINAFSLYGTHQQGAGGFNMIIKNKKLSKRIERNLRQNLPKRYKYASGKILRNAWMSFWKKRLA